MYPILERMTHIIPDRLFLQLKFRQRMGKWPDLDHPHTFNEKLQWLKLHDRKLIYSTMVDKYEAKKYVAEIIGEEHIIPTFGVWSRFGDIDFASLPNQFVLKCTHDSGGLYIVRDKATMDFNFAREKITRSMKNNYYWHGREWAYKSVKPRIIAEQYMEDNRSDKLIDYKFYCFNGVARFLYVSYGLEDHKTARLSFVSLEWEKMPFWRADYEQFAVLPPRPQKLNEMIEFAKALSIGIPFVRVDFYEINGQVYFGELTLYPGIGMNRFTPKEYDRIIGDYLELRI